MSDVAGVLRILDVYRMAVMRFKGDLELWFRYLEFCREKRHGRMKKGLAQAIRYHPEVPGLWIYAAAWQFDQNLNVVAARALMQSGLRACPKSEDLWIEYLRMELTYLNKLKARKVALGENVRMLDRNSGEAKQWKEENKDLFMTMSVNEESEDVEGEDLFWQRGSMILQTIYQGAVDALPSSMSMRKRFLEILDTVDLAHSDRLKEEILEDLKKQFSHDEHYWDWIARLQISSPGKSGPVTKPEALAKLNKAVEVYEEAVDVIPSVQMFSLYTKFWLDMIIPNREGSNSLFSEIEIDVSEFSSSILKVYQNAESRGCLTEDLAYQYISFYLRSGKLEDARILAEKLCNSKLSGAASLWILRLSIEMKWLADKSASVSGADLSYVYKFLKNVLTKISISEAEDLWLMAIKLFCNSKDHFENLVKSLTTALANAGGSYSGYAVSSAIVNWTLQRDGIKSAREMYKRFLALPHPSLGLYRHCIELESNLASVGDCDGTRNARKLYDSALGLYAENRELWKDYYSMEMKIGTSESANAVYWRALKTLKDTTGLSGPF